MSNVLSGSKMQNKYTSFSGKKVNGAQYIAEILCKRRLEHEGHQLPQRFWTIDEFKKSYMTHLFIVRNALKFCSEKALINALNRKNLSKVYSTRNKDLIKAIKEEELKIKKESELKARDITDVKKFKKTKNNFLDKLR